MGRPLRIATRASRLALWQSRWVTDRLTTLHPGLTVELLEVRTQGDRDRETPLATIGGVGVFTKEIQRALLDGHAHFAVHSLKDLPTQIDEDLTIAAIPPRESPFDALIAPTYGTLHALPEGARVGTSSPRRRALLLHARPDLVIVDVRGNVETRLRHALDGRLDAVVLAEAGMRRLGLESHVTERLQSPQFLPAVGQGALAIECLESNREVTQLIRLLDDPPTRLAVTAERALLASLQGGCSVPVAALATYATEGVTLDAAVLDTRGATRIDAHEGPSGDPQALGIRVAADLRARGADRLLQGT